MSFIHLDKSIVTFHFKEILEDGHLGSPLTLIGLGALLLSTKLSASASRSSSPYPSGISLSQWVRQQATVATPAPKATVSISHFAPTQTRRVA
jgi:hypothetical protein